MFLCMFFPFKKICSIQNSYLNMCHLTTIRLCVLCNLLLYLFHIHSAEGCPKRKKTSLRSRRLCIISCNARFHLLATKQSLLFIKKRDHFATLVMTNVLFSQPLQHLVSYCTLFAPLVMLFRSPCINYYVPLYGIPLFIFLLMRENMMDFSFFEMSREKTIYLTLSFLKWLGRNQLLKMFYQFAHRR
jgi:hypothetical protein